MQALRLASAAAAVLALLCGTALLAGACGSPKPKGPPAVVVVSSPGPAALDEAIAKVKSGGTVRLDAAEYHLTAPLTLSKPVTIVGQGTQRTEISCTAKEWVVKLTGGGPYAFEGLTLRHRGRADSDVVTVDGAKATFTRCRITGARGSSDWTGTGIWATGASTCAVQSCLFTKNQVGIMAEGETVVQVQNTQCTSNSISGIELLGKAGGTLQANSMDDTAEAIWISTSGEVTIDGNMIADSYDGITLTGPSQATVTGNRVEGNDQYGIRIEKKAGGDLSGNICMRNIRGISLLGKGEVTLSDNLCEWNREVGIGAWGTMRGRVEGNTCDHNGTNESGGICLGGKSSMTVKANVCRQNGNYGILFRDSAKGSANRNTCKGCEYGLIVDPSATPRLGANRCSGSIEDLSDWR